MVSRVMEKSGSLKELKQKSPRDSKSALRDKHNNILTNTEGDTNNFKNDRRLSLLSHIYWHFMKIFTNRLTAKLYLLLPTSRANWVPIRIQHKWSPSTLKSLTIENTVEYNKPLVLVFLHYEKTFYTINKQEMLKSPVDCRIDHQYFTIKQLYENATSCVRIHGDNFI